MGEGGCVGRGGKGGGMDKLKEWCEEWMVGRGWGGGLTLSVRV